MAPPSIFAQPSFQDRAVMELYAAMNTHMAPLPGALRDWADEQVLELLPGCSARFVEQMLATIKPRYRAAYRALPSTGSSDEALDLMDGGLYTDWQFLFVAKHVLRYRDALDL